MSSPATAPSIDSPEVKTLSFRQLREQEFPAGNFIIGEGLLPSNGMLFIGGPPKSWKSFVLSSMLYHLVTGTNLFGTMRKSHGRETPALPVASPQRVLLLEQEIGFYDVRERMLPFWKSMLPEHQQLVDENLFIHSRDHTMDLGTVEGCRRIEGIIKAVRPTVVAFDPFIEFHTLNENDTQHMAMTFRNLDAMRNTLAFATAITHHTGKPSMANARTGPDLLRGNSVIFGKGDSFLMLKPLNRAAGKLRCDFTIRRGAPIRSINMLLDWSDLRAKFYEWSTRSNSKPTEEDQDVTDQ